jgi:hypothetical protein
MCDYDHSVAIELPNKKELPAHLITVVCEIYIRPSRRLIITISNCNPVFRIYLPKTE